VLGLATHYMAIVTVVPEAVLLLYRFRHRRAVWAVVVLVFATGAALVPLAVAQHGTRRTLWIEDTSLGFRVGQLGAHFAAGFQAPIPLLAVAAVGAAVGLVLVSRTEPLVRRSTVMVAAIGVAGLLLAIGLALAGLDEVIPRNLLAAWVPLAAAVAVGLGARRIGMAGLALTAVVCAAWLTVDGRVVADRWLQRPDWRNVLDALGPVGAPRILVLQHFGSKMPLFIYDTTMKRMGPSRMVTVAEVDVIAADVREVKGCWWGASCNLNPAPPPGGPPIGFRRAEWLHVPDFRIVRFRSQRPVRLHVRHLRRQLRYVEGGAVLLQRPSRPPDPRLSREG
jgi:hypothetical protein